MLSRKALVPLVAVAAIGLSVGGAIHRRAGSSGPASGPLPVVPLGGIARVEGCLLCHATTQGLAGAHATIGCSSCHLGDATARTAEAAHVGMDLLAGGLPSVGRTCGQAACHPVEAARVITSLMARAPGILAVDRFVFGERARPDGDGRDDLLALDPAKDASTLAESHVRQLCAGCHLGGRKERVGDLGDEARGGGCTACHLAPPAAREHDTGGPLHPDVSAAVSERRCTGCHARSGRISLSYHGIVELEPGDPRVTARLRDGRPIGAASVDVHARAGMTCIDCHTERELMGDGAEHRHAEEGLDVACEDCHRPGGPRAMDPDRDAVADRLRASWLRRGMPRPPAVPLRTRAGTPLWRTSAEGRTLLLATTGEVRAIPAASDRPYHALRGHERLDCQACHAEWAPRCQSCHTTFDPGGEGIDLLSARVVRGRWVEESGDNGFAPPLLALGPRGRIEPFVEGMRLRIDVPAREAIDRTLWAPLDPHTTGKARSCPSCHAPAAPDEVFPRIGEATRSGARLFQEAEIGRILRVGRCVACHPTYEDPIYLDFEASFARRGQGRAPRCKGTR